MKTITWIICLMFSAGCVYIGEIEQSASYNAAALVILASLMDRKE